MFPTKFQALSVQLKKRKIDFQDHFHLGFLIGTILAIFDLQVTLMLLTKFRVSWPFSSGEEGKNRFSRWPPWQPSWEAGLGGSVGCTPTGDQKVAGSIPAEVGDILSWRLTMKYFVRSISSFL